MSTSKGPLTRLRTLIAYWARRHPLLLALALAVGGMLALTGFHTGMNATNNLEFCTSCHEMADNNFQEYKKTVHYQNRTGVRATCPDCHVPKDEGPKLLRKVQAASDIWHTLAGTIDTREKFEAHRLEMAQREWARMKASDSRECRSCHSFEGMSADDQRPKTYARHMKAKDEGRTCIDCHKGIAHQLPKGYVEEDDR
jgi:cytochrome c-type protein NapC